MSNYTTVDTTFDGPEPTRDPRSAPVTVTVSATTKEGSIVTRSVKVQQDTKITSLIDAVLSVEDNLHFPTLITGFFPSGAVQTQNNTILPKAVRTSYRYETFDVTVTDQSTCWAPPPSSNHHPRPLSGTALQYDYPNLINLHDPFVKMWNRLTRPAEGYVAKTVEDKTIKYQDLEVSFRRTVRVPNDGRSHPLPADLGPFELVNVAKYSNNLPEFMRRKGGLLVPMYNSEAMWIAFQRGEIPKPIAIRVYTGGVNAISGESSSSMRSLLAGKLQYTPDPLTQKQNHVVSPGQKWIDGIMTGDHEVRQFVATPFHSGTSVESQLTGRDAVGGLQLEFIPSYDTKCSVRFKNKEYDVYQSPSSAGLPVCSVVQLRGPPRKEVTEVDYTIADYQAFFGSYGPNLQIQVSTPRVIYARTLHGKIIPLSVRKLAGLTALGVKELIQVHEGIATDQQRLIFRGQEIDNDRTLIDYGVSYESTLGLVLRLRGGGTGEPLLGPQAMAVGAGGKITQTVHQDQYDPRIWDLEAASVINIQFINALDFANVTGLRPHPTPITREEYERMGLPWFRDFDKDIEALKDADGPSRFRDLVTLKPEIPRNAFTFDIVLMLALGQAILDKKIVVKPWNSENDGEDTNQPLLQWLAKPNIITPIPIGPGSPSPPPPPPEWTKPHRPLPKTYALKPPLPPPPPQFFGYPGNGATMHPGNALQEPPFQPYPAPRPHNGPQQGYHPPAGLPPPTRPNVIDAQVRKPSKPSKLARIFKILME